LAFEVQRPSGWTGLGSWDFWSFYFFNPWQKKSLENDSYYPAILASIVIGPLFVWCHWWKNPMASYFWMGFLTDQVGTRSHSRFLFDPPKWTFSISDTECNWFLPCIFFGLEEKQETLQVWIKTRLFLLIIIGLWPFWRWESTDE